MQTITTIGLDFAKSVLHVHGVDAAGEVVIRRNPPAGESGDWGERLKRPLASAETQAWNETRNMAEETAVLGCAWTRHRRPGW